MKDVGQVYWEQYVEKGEELSNWFSFIEKDPARKTVSILRFEEDWKGIRKATNESRSQQGKVIGARKTIMKRWGERATKMASVRTYYTIAKLRYITGKHPNFEDGIALINRAILLRIRQCHAKNNPWTTEPQALDYEHVRDIGEELPQLTPQNLEKFNLYLDENKVLRQMHGRSGGGTRHIAEEGFVFGY